MLSFLFLGSPYYYSAAARGAAPPAAAAAYDRHWQNKPRSTFTTSRQMTPLESSRVQLLKSSYMER